MEGQRSNGKSEGGKKKRPAVAPFRLKVGSVAVVRQHFFYEHQHLLLNNDEDEQQLVCLWSSPIYTGTSRKASPLLVGRRIRCAVPSKDGNNNSSGKKAFVEGEVIRYETSGVELLMDSARVPAATTTSGAAAIERIEAPTHRKTWKAEEAIRGRGKVLVRFPMPKELVVLKYVPSKLSQGRKRKRAAAVPNTPVNGETTILDDSSVLPLGVTTASSHKTPLNKKKTVPAAVTSSCTKVLLPPAVHPKPPPPPPPESATTTTTTTTPKQQTNGSSATTTTTKKQKPAVGLRHVGDGHDTEEQQVQNWRWLANHRYNNEPVMMGQVLAMDTKASGTLAMVTLQPMVYDKNNKAHFDCDRTTPWEIPVEHLIMVGRAVGEEDGMISCPDAYSSHKDVFLPWSGDAEPAQTFTAFCCHHCRKHERLLSSDLVSCANCDLMWCEGCLRKMRGEDPKCFPCCGMACDCTTCLELRRSRAEDELGAAIGLQSDAISDPFRSAADKLLHLKRPVHFQLPPGFLDMTPIPRLKPSTKKKDPVSSSPKAKRRLGRSKGTDGKRIKNGKRKLVREPSFHVQPEEDYSVFKPTCARTKGYDGSAKKFFFNATAASAELVRNMRDVQETRLITEAKRKDNERSSSRAARANQRRLMKNVKSSGAHSFGLVDALANREPQLRFDRSGIHAWGVFADESISAGEMIVEYRGELIGNAVTERREVEYEDAKIGSDYMFRIDSLNVCDATKQGNVARFINASCDPNCYTKIIPVDGTKRIVIYSKKNINVGDELTYDYKFPLEYDESKRIPCHCGTRSCRGFMNWDRRYVVSPEMKEKHPPQLHGSPKRLKCASEDTLTALHEVSR